MTDLSARERKVLSALLGWDRPMSNAELAAAAGLRLVGTERRRLNDLKLVQSARRGREFVHELTDFGAEALIEATYHELAAGPGQFVGLRELRERLGCGLGGGPDGGLGGELGSGLAGAPRARLDAALMELYAGQRINLVPRSNQAALTAADREAALRVGGEHKHLMSIER